MKEHFHGSNEKAQKITQNDAQFALIPLDCNDEIAVLSLCVGVHVDSSRNYFRRIQTFWRPIHFIWPIQYGPLFMVLFIWKVTGHQNLWRTNLPLSGMVIENC